MLKNLHSVAGRQAGGGGQMTHKEVSSASITVSNYNGFKRRCRILNGFTLFEAA